MTVLAPLVAVALLFLAAFVVALAIKVIGLAVDAAEWLVRKVCS